MKIAIFGLARSGLSALKVLVQEGKHEIFLVNAGPPHSWPNFDMIKQYVDDEHCFDQKNATSVFAKMHEIILSPGIPREHEALQEALNLAVPIVSEIEFAYKRSSVPVIGITGTNGKTTTTTMVGKLLELAGLNVFVGGNIGIPYSEILLSKQKFDVAVIELSSFQLESINDFHPHIALLLNISDNHGERYRVPQDYLKAKLNIFKNQTENDFAIINESINFIPLHAKRFNIPNEKLPIFKHAKLVGKHNRQNYFCAKKVLELLAPKFNLKEIDIVFEAFLEAFNGVDYRLQYVGEYKKLKFYNDAKSTNNAATSVAIDAFDETNWPVHLIVGGKLRTDETDLPEMLLTKKIQTIFAIGEAGPLVASKLKEKKCKMEIIVCKNLDDVRSYVLQMPLEGVLVFSPGFPSFDQYKNFEERGKHFRQLFENIGEAKN